jgi:hypothetical protein
MIKRKLTIFLAALAVVGTVQIVVAGAALAEGACVPILAGEEGTAALRACINVAVNDEATPYVTISLVKGYTPENTPPPIVSVYGGLLHAHEGPTVVEAKVRVDGVEALVAVFLSPEIDDSRICTNDPRFLHTGDCIFIEDYVGIPIGLPPWPGV